MSVRKEGAVMEEGKPSVKQEKPSVVRLPEKDEFGSEPQWMKCVRGEHERIPQHVQMNNDTSVEVWEVTTFDEDYDNPESRPSNHRGQSLLICRHCRCLYVERV